MPWLLLSHSAGPVHQRQRLRQSAPVGLHIFDLRRILGMCALRAAALSRIRLRDPRRDMSCHSGGMHPHRLPLNCALQPTGLRPAAERGIVRCSR